MGQGLCEGRKSLLTSEERGRRPFDGSIVPSTALQIPHASPPPPQGQSGKLGRLSGARGSGRAGTNLLQPLCCPLGQRCRAIPVAGTEHTKEAPTRPQTWGHSGEEAGLDPESEHLPPLRGTIAAASPGQPGGRAAQRPSRGRATM